MIRVGGKHEDQMRGDETASSSPETGECGVWSGEVVLVSAFGEENVALVQRGTAKPPNDGGREDAQASFMTPESQSPFLSFSDRRKAPEDITCYIAKCRHQVTRSFVHALAPRSRAVLYRNRDFSTQTSNLLGENYIDLS